MGELIGLYEKNGVDIILMTPKVLNPWYTKSVVYFYSALSTLSSMYYRKKTVCGVSVALFVCPNIYYRTGLQHFSSANDRAKQTPPALL